MNLVIVESPAKGKTIEKYLGKDYRVLASFGHVRDLPKNELGVDTDHNYEPKYVIPPKARKVLSALKAAIAQSDQVYLATDYDREGEAIAWHIVQACGLENSKSQASNSKQIQNSKSKITNNKPVFRITFHEITKDAIVEAVKKPRTLDMDLINAQQARRILDRLVGYKLSPFLWKKVFKGLSAGRVQSVVVRLIVDREREIQAFVPQEYWSIKAELQPTVKDQSSVTSFFANLIEVDGKKLDKLAIKSESEAGEITKNLENAQYIVENITQKDENRFSYPPFTTSTLQQESSKRLGFSAKQTMKLAQDLYEDGLITYMRTDSVNLAVTAVSAARSLIEHNYGKEYLPNSPKLYKTKSKGAQEAHEAIRPTDVTVTGAPNVSSDHEKLYNLIWSRMIASQMNPMILATMSVDIMAKSSQLKANSYLFRANGSTIKFDGFSKVWAVKMEEKSLPNLTIKDLLILIKLFKDQHSTEPPARYNEASLIKYLEEQGIGRPSTYAPTISTIQDRGYVYLDKKVFFPKEVGFIVTDMLVANFPDIVDVKFTAKMEESLDDVAEGKGDWVKMLDDFYKPFIKNLGEKEGSVEKTQTDEKTDKKCSKCGKDMVIKMGKFGKFLACTGFPECKNTEQILVKTGLACPDCKTGDVIERKTRRGKTFWGCSAYPNCKWASWNDPNKRGTDAETNGTDTEDSK
jgi:DNA topoisomerase-1